MSANPGTVEIVAQGRRVARWLVAALAVALGLVIGPAAAQEPRLPLQLRIVGGLAGVSQYKQLEAPFWEATLPRLSNGRITATIHPFDRSGLSGPDMLQLMRLGVVPFGTALLSVAASDEPELNPPDLAALNPTFEALRSTVGHFRPHMEALLRERYGIELLGVYAYPAQVVWCSAPFGGLKDLAGRRIRTSSVGQSEMMSALGAVPVITPFAEVVEAVRKKVVDCAVTGTMSGAEIGLPEVTTHIHAMAISWGLSIFAANRDAWLAISWEDRETLRQGIAGLEEQIWQAADRDTGTGLRCAVDAPGCTSEKRGKLTLVESGPADDALRRKVLVEAVLPRWIDRCGPGCVEVWNNHLGESTGLRLSLKANPEQTGTPHAKPVTPSK